MCAGNESTLYFNNLTPEQWQQARARILSRAEAARAQALRDVVGAVGRGLRTAAWGGAAISRAAAGAVVAAAGQWWRAYAARRERIAAVRELRALDDRTLKDIGVNRSEIEWVVRGQDTTRLRDATIAANRARPRYPTAGAGTTSRRPQSTTRSIHKSAA
jgi:uncharacterized protein YjiS (DUF1127 family)